MRKDRPSDQEASRQNQPQVICENSNQLYTYDLSGQGKQILNNFCLCAVLYLGLQACREYKPMLLFERGSLNETGAHQLTRLEGK